MQLRRSGRFAADAAEADSPLRYTADVQALAFWKAVTMDRADFLEGLIALLEEHRIHYCVIGGQGVNAYVEPLVSLDLDLVVAVEQLAQVETLLRERFRVEQFPHSLNVSAPGSELRVQIHTDPHYFNFPKRAAMRDVLGMPLPVAAIEDLLDGKIWAALDPERRGSKRRKHLLDVERLLDARPDLRSRVPSAILDRLSEF